MERRTLTRQAFSRKNEWLFVHPIRRVHGHTRHCFSHQKGQSCVKLIAGTDGYNATILAKELRSSAYVPTIGEAYGLAVKCSFGSEEDLVVLTKDEVLFRGDSDLDERYRRSFSNPSFNPRWEHGSADYIELVQL
jgi:hypothetical protein